MSTESRFALRLAKEDFKFSSAHFTVFGPEEAELLHGHNYRVSVEVNGPGVDDLGFLEGVAPIKRAIRGLCASLDERVLLPERSPYVTVERRPESIEVRFGERVYVLPSRDVVLLPLANVTLELLARHFWEHLEPELDPTRLQRLTVVVEETAGQAGCYTDLLRRR